MIGDKVERIISLVVGSPEAPMLLRDRHPSIVDELAAIVQGDINAVCDLATEIERWAPLCEDDARYLAAKLIELGWQRPTPESTS